MPATSAMTNTESFDLDVSLRAGTADIAQIGTYLDGLDEPTRIQVVRSLSARAQAALYEAAKGARAVTAADMVPTGIPPLVEVPHYGVNSLAMFRTFSKVFCRTPSGDDELIGYNRSGGFVETFVGPGYYVAYALENGEFVVDYTRPPSEKPAHWPEILRNEARLSRFVYAGMKDVLRGVSRHVTIGRAVRNGKVADNWFALCRAER